MLCFFVLFSLALHPLSPTQLGIKIKNSRRLPGIQHEQLPSEFKAFHNCEDQTAYLPFKEIQYFTCFDESGKKNAL